MPILPIDNGRYGSKEMKSIFDECKKLTYELRFEAAVAERKREASSASCRDNARSNTPGRDDSQGRASMKVYLFASNDFLK